MGKFGLCNYGYIPQPHTNAQGWADGSSLGVKVIGTLMGIVQMANARNKNLVNAIMMMVDEFDSDFECSDEEIEDSILILSS